MEPFEFVPIWTFFAPKRFFTMRRWPKALPSSKFDGGSRLFSKTTLGEQMLPHPNFVFLKRSALPCDLSDLLTGVAAGLATGLISTAIALMSCGAQAADSDKPLADIALFPLFLFLFLGVITEIIFNT